MSQNLLSKPVHPQGYISIVCDTKGNVNLTVCGEIRKFESRNEGLGTRSRKSLVTGDYIPSSGIAIIYTSRRFYSLMRRTTISHFSFKRGFQTQSKGAPPHGLTLIQSLSDLLSVSLRRTLYSPPAISAYAGRVPIDSALLTASRTARRMASSAR